MFHKWSFQSLYRLVLVWYTSVVKISHFECSQHLAAFISERSPLTRAERAKKCFPYRKKSTHTLFRIMSVIRHILSIVSLFQIGQISERFEMVRFRKAHRALCHAEIFVRHASDQKTCNFFYMNHLKCDLLYITYRFEILLCVYKIFFHQIKLIFSDVFISKYV